MREYTGRNLLPRVRALTAEIERLASLCGDSDARGLAGHVRQTLSELLDAVRDASGAGDRDSLVGSLTLSLKYTGDLEHQMRKASSGSSPTMAHGLKCRTEIAAIQRVLRAMLDTMALQPEFDDRAACGLPLYQVEHDPSHSGPSKTLRGEDQ